MPKIMTLPECEPMTNIGVPGRKRYERRDVPVATQEELLEFCNKFRQAGGGDPITALLPGVQMDAEACLIASNMNFNCFVDGLWDDENTWTIDLDRWDENGHDERFTNDQIEAMSKVIGRPPREHKEELDVLSWILPAHIGNAADAFDRGVWRLKS